VLRDVSAKLADCMVIVNAGESIYVEELKTTLTALDAGHCPGSLLFLLDHKPSGACVLHTGDMRASERVRTQPGLATFRTGGARQLDAVYLDTTYADKRYDFPAQADACAEIGAIVRRELEREPKTLFLCNTYTVGKENAFDAAADAAGGRCYVPARRAESLRMCGRWRDAVHTEDATDPAVRVWVGGAMSGLAENVGAKGGGDGGPHERLLKLLQDSAGRYAAVVSLRCTGWEYRRGQRSTPVWAANDGATRCYGVPYSEHSSFPELEAFVAALRPRRVVPTVNAASRKGRERLRDLFSPGVDRSKDKGRIDAYFGGSPLATVDVARQARLLAAFDDGESPVAASDVAALRGVVGDAPTAYCERLLRDAGGDVARSVDVHFGANGGMVPREFYAAASAPAADDDGDDAGLLVGAVFAVKGRDEDFKLFASSRSGAPPPPKRQRGSPRPKAQQPGGAADRIRDRLRQLGACVVAADARGDKKLAPTHVVVPEGTEPGTLTGLAHLVRVRTESWLIRRCRALDAGTLAPPPKTALAEATVKAKGPVKAKTPDKGPRGETRAGPRRKRTGETDAAVGRACSETMYLVARRDETRPPPPSACRAPPLRRVFVVLGSTGNVYDVAIEKQPSCTCPLAVKHPTKVCKHRYFVYYKVLKLPRDDGSAPPEDPDGLAHVPHQRYLRRDELKAILVDRNPENAPLASRAARDAYRRVSGGGVIDVDDDDDDVAPAAAPRRPLDECTVCFEPFAEAGDDADFCHSCGRNYHAACLTRWFLHKRARVCAVCAAPWRDDAPAADATATTEEGFLNLRALQPGVAAERDTSTYATNDEGRRWADVHAERAEEAAATTEGGAPFG